MEESRKLFEIVSYFLSYPNEEWMSEFSDTSSSVSCFNDEKLYSLLNQFIVFVQHKEFDFLMQNYIETFDFGALTNLYITYDKYGEQRERGQALLSLKHLYESESYEMEENELPDYLPLVLEFLSVCTEENANKIIYSLGPVLEIMSGNLKKIKSPYSFLTDSLLYIIHKENILYPTNNKEASSL